MDVYAHFHGGCPEHYTWDGSGCVIYEKTVTIAVSPVGYGTVNSGSVTTDY